MTEFIEDALKIVQEDFFKKEWCELNSIELDTENYQDVCQQEYYLLKYFPAYLAEYYTMYSELFESYDKDSINIISIGCGAGIDYYALENIDKKPKVNYFGIDLIDWKHKPSSSNFSFEQLDIGQLNNLHFDHIDLIVLPKILTELSDDQVSDLAKKIVNANLSDELYFLNSYITDDSHDVSRVDGISKFEIICKELINNDFSIVGDNSCNQYMHFKEHAGIRKHIPSFVYPNDIKDFLCNLKSNCTKFDESIDDCNQCQIGEYPMMTSKYIAFNVIKFEKNDN